MEKLLEGGNERDVIYKKYVDETVVSVKGRQKQDLHAVASKHVSGRGLHRLALEDE
jgi:hypothetical protein